MTDLKMCKWVEGEWLKGNYEGDGWVPVEPQPCCANCKKESWCGIASEITHADGDLDKFFCASWEAKK